jgi:hypothetical protein
VSNETEHEPEELRADERQRARERAGASLDDPASFLGRRPAVTPTPAPDQENAT